ncbi:hypothetical protein NHJ6243_003160 [Beauveria neobassiana]
MGPPKPPVPHVAPIYRLTATALGAGMWFWLMYRAKKDGTIRLADTNTENIAFENGSVSQKKLTFFFPTGPVLMGWKHPWDH